MSNNRDHLVGQLTRAMPTGQAFLQTGFSNFPGKFQFSLSAFFAGTSPFAGNLTFGVFSHVECSTFRNIAPLWDANFLVPAPEIVPASSPAALAPALWHFTASYSQKSISSVTHFTISVWQNPKFWTRPNQIFFWDQFFQAAFSQKHHIRDSMPSQWLTFLQNLLKQKFKMINK